MLIIMSFIDCQSPADKLRVDKGYPQVVQQGKFLFYMNKKFTGLLEETYRPGRIKSLAEYRAGLLNGRVVTWYEDGSTESIRIYKNGEKEGVHKGWWQNGRRMFEYTFNAGEYHGAFREWYENGSMLHDFMYGDEGVISATGWRENGKAYINYVVRNGRKYGLTNARLCYSLKAEKGFYTRATY
jgi:hypothetical protein